MRTLIRQRQRTHEKGSVILLVMVFMAVILSLGLVTINVTVSEMEKTAKEIRYIQSFYHAEAGLERAMRKLKDIWNASQDWSSVLDGADNIPGNADDGILSFGATVSFNGGSYSVVVSDNDDGDSDLYTDSDDTVAITSTGVAPDGTSRIIEAEVSASAFNPGATVYLHGSDWEVDFSADLFLVSGDDYNIGALTPTAVGTAYAASTSGPSLAVADTYKDNFQGKDYDPGPTPPVPSIKTSAPADDIQSLISYYSRYAHYVLGEGTYTSGYGSSTDYKIVYATGDIRLSGNKAGYGLLICEGKVELKGIYTWTGVIIVGDEAKFQGPNNDEARLYGAVYIGNFSGADVEPELKIGDKAYLLFSSQAISRTNQSLPLRVNYWKEL